MLEKIKEGWQEGVSSCAASSVFRAEWTNGLSTAVKLLWWRGRAAPRRARSVFAGLWWSSCPEARVTYVAASPGY